MGSIPATLDITFLKRRIASSQFVRRNQPNKVTKIRKIPASSAAISSKNDLIPTHVPLRHTRPNIFLTRTRSGQRLNQKPYQAINGPKIALFFTFKKLPTSLFASDSFSTASSAAYFWHAHKSRTQFFWSTTNLLTPSFQELGDSWWSYQPQLNPTTHLTAPQLLMFSSSPLPKVLPIPTTSHSLVRNFDFLFYQSKVLSYTQRSVTLRVNAFQRALYDQTKYYKTLKERVAYLNVASRYSKNRFLILFTHHLSPQILSGVSTREQIPDFRDIPRTRSHFMPSFTRMRSLTGLILSKNRKGLLRAYSHITPSVNISRPKWLFSKDTLGQQTLMRSDLTKLVSGGFRQFMIKRLFRPTPIKTHIRALRRTRRWLTRGRFPNFLPEVEKSNKLVSYREYEEALFKEMLSTPPGVEGPLLKTFLYTGFEAMPLLNQKLGNKLFRKNRRIRPSVLACRMPNLGKRRHIVRTQLRITTPWAQRADLLRPVIKDLRDHNSTLATLSRTSSAEKRRYRYTLRYWRKRAAYFSRHSAWFAMVRRRYPRFKKKLRLRKKRFSRNFSIKKDLLLSGTLTPSPKKRVRFRYSNRPRRRPKKRKLRGFKLRFRQRVLSDFRFRFISIQPKKNLNALPKSFWVRRRGRMKLFRLYRRLRLLPKSGLGNLHQIPYNLTQYFKGFTSPKCPNHSLPPFPENMMSSLPSTTPLTPLVKFWPSQALRKYSFFNQLLRFTPQFATWKMYLTSTYTVNFSLMLQNQLSAFYFGPQLSCLQRSNLWTLPSLHFTLRKKILRSVSQSSFSSDTGSWAHKCLIQFAERISGRRTAIYIGPFVDQALTIEDHARCVIWNTRSSGFRKILGHRIFTSEALMVLTSSIRLKDPTLLSNWIQGMLKRLSFWRYRVLFRYLKFLIQHLFRFSFPEFHFKGFKLRLKGKISVGGNSRSRVLFYRVGDTSHSKMANRVAYDLSYINTFTGVLGFKLWFFY